MQTDLRPSKKNLLSVGINIINFLLSAKPEIVVPGMSFSKLHNRVKHKYRGMIEPSVP